jgi:hypothetical protein
MNDTQPAVEAILIEGFRRMSAAEKFSRVEALNNTVLEFAALRLRKKYGDLSEHELRLRLASLWLDRETMIRVFGWDPEVHGR